MLTKLRKLYRDSVRPLVSLLVRLGVNANHLTLLSLILALIYIPLLIKGWLPAAIVLILLMGFLDAIDGEVARQSGTASPLGSFLDSFIDRIVDVVIIGGLIFLQFDVILVYVLAVTSLLISYCRAKGEALRIKMEGVGLIERAERIIMIVMVLLLYYILGFWYSYIVFIILLILSVITLFQRVLHIVLAFKESKR